MERKVGIKSNSQKDISCYLELQHFEGQGGVRVEFQCFLLFKGPKCAGRQQIEITTCKANYRASAGYNSKCQTILLTSISFQILLFFLSAARTET